MQCCISCKDAEGRNLTCAHHDRYDRATPCQAPGVDSHGLNRFTRLLLVLPRQVAMSRHPVQCLRVTKLESAMIVRDGYAALPTTPRQDCVQDGEALCTQPNAQQPDLHESPKQQINHDVALKRQQQVLPPSVPKVQLKVQDAVSTPVNQL